MWYVSTKFSQRFLFSSLKNTRCFAEIWSKAAYKNEILKKFCDYWGLTIGVARNFHWGKPKPQITCSDVIGNFERRVFCGGKDIVEWKIKSHGLVLARNLELVQGRGLKPIVKMRKCLNWETCLSKGVFCNSNVSQSLWLWGSGGEAMGVWESGGEAPNRWATFRNFLEKKAFLIPLDHISHIFIAI